jgi:hypothetical protein
VNSSRTRISPNAEYLREIERMRAENKMHADDEANLVMGLTVAIKPLLAGRPPHVTSAVLANLTALWLAGHVAVDSDDPDATAKVREELLYAHVQLIQGLIEPSEREILDMIVDRRSPQ